MSWSLTLFFKKNNCGLACICSLESEFIEKIVENIWKILKEEESATAPSRRQHSVPIIPPQNDASSRHNDFSEWTPFFFFLKKPNLNRKSRGIALVIWWVDHWLFDFFFFVYLFCIFLLLFWFYVGGSTSARSVSMLFSPLFKKDIYVGLTKMIDICPTNPPKFTPPTKMKKTVLPWNVFRACHLLLSHLLRSFILFQIYTPATARLSLFQKSNSQNQMDYSSVLSLAQPQLPLPFPPPPPPWVLTASAAEHHRSNEIGLCILWKPWKSSLPFF